MIVWPVGAALLLWMEVSHIGLVRLCRIIYIYIMYVCMYVCIYVCMYAGADVYIC